MDLLRQLFPFTLPLVLAIFLVGCSKDESEPTPLVGNCETNPVPGLDCECFQNAVGNDKYSAVAEKLDTLANSEVGESAAGLPEFDQDDINSMMDLVGTVETDCATTQ